MNRVIDTIIDGIIEREGEYSDHPADRGGPTKYGITEQVARANGYTGDMRDFPEWKAREIYLDRYWLEPHFDLVANRDVALADELADTGVLMGPMTATRFLQRALNVLNRGGTTYPDINADGSIGRMTLFALDSLVAKRGADAYRVLTAMVNAQQSVRMIEIAEAKPSQEEFEYGWQRGRVA